MLIDRHCQITQVDLTAARRWLSFTGDFRLTDGFQAGDSQIALNSGIFRCDLELALQPREFQTLQVFNIVPHERWHGDLGRAGAVESDLRNRQDRLLVAVPLGQLPGPVTAVRIQSGPHHRAGQLHRYAGRPPPGQRHGAMIDLLANRKRQIGGIIAFRLGDFDASDDV